MAKRKLKPALQRAHELYPDLMRARWPVIFRPRRLAYHPELIQEALSRLTPEELGQPGKLIPICIPTRWELIKGWFARIVARPTSTLSNPNR